MSAVLTLYVWALRRDRGVLLTFALLLYALEVLIVWAARLLDTGNAFPKIAGLVPTFVRESAGFDVSLLLTFRGAVGIGYFHPAVVAALVATAVLALREPVAEVDERTVELLVARPIPRWAIMARSLAVLATCALLLPLAMLGGTATGLATAGRLDDLPFEPYLWLALNDASLVLGLGGVFAVSSAVSRRSRTYTQLAVGFALVSYVVDFLGRVWPPIRPLGILSPFHYVESAPALAGRPEMAGVLLLVGLALVASLSALAVFQKRDL